MLDLIIDSNNVVELRDLRNNVTQEAITDAAVSVTLVDGKGDPVIGTTWPQNLSHVDSGTYRTTLDYGLQLISGRNYTGLLRAATTSGQERTWQLKLKALSDKVY